MRRIKLLVVAGVLHLAVYRGGMQGVIFLASKMARNRRWIVGADAGFPERRPTLSSAKISVRME